jgi:hypothetical protein
MDLLFAAPTSAIAAALGWLLYPRKDDFFNLEPSSSPTKTFPFFLSVWELYSNALSMV